MRYAIFTDVHANLEALEAVLARIDELSSEEHIDQIWFLGDLVGYGPNPNECIEKLRARTDVIIAGNHDWAAVGKISLDDFSEAARISAEWTAEQLTEEHRQFLLELPERIDLEKANCVLVHGSPYGPLWEYLTSEVLAERSFECFTTRYCFVGHTHVPIIFQQPEAIANVPTIPLSNNELHILEEDDDDTAELATICPIQQTSLANTPTEQSHGEPLPSNVEKATNILAEIQQIQADNLPVSNNNGEHTATDVETTEQPDIVREQEPEQESTPAEDDSTVEVTPTTPEDAILNAEERLNEEIEELLTLLGLSQSMVRVNNEMIIPPEGDWQAPEHYRAIVNPGGVGQPRDGNSRAAFMIYDTEYGFTFHRVFYPIEKTQEKIVKAGLPPYLATRLAFGR